MNPRTASNLSVGAILITLILCLTYYYTHESQLENEAINDFARRTCREVIYPDGVKVDGFYSAERPNLITCRRMTLTFITDTTHPLTVVKP